jgi:uncharacterized protein YaaN involved in tellurite resistance
MDMTRTETKDRFHRMASELMENMDFTRIHHTMQVLDWRYQGERQSEGDIRIFCRRLLHETIERVLDSPTGEAFLSTGGFEISIYHPDHLDEERAGTLDVKFVVEHDMMIFDQTKQSKTNIQEQIDEILTRLDRLEDEVNRYIVDYRE